MLGISWQFLLFLFVLFEWGLRFTMIFIVPKGRRPSSAISWLLLIMVLPTIGSIIFALFGYPKLPEHRRKVQAQADKLTDREVLETRKSNPELFSNSLDKNIASIAELAKSLGGLPAVNGNRAKIITEYSSMISEQAKAIDSAQQYVHMEYFIFTLDDETEPIFSALTRARQRGVEVRILFDRFVTKRFPNHKKTIKKLNEIGARWEETLPINIMPGKQYTRPDLRNHRKLTVVDGHIAFCGSANVIAKNYHRNDNLVYEETMLRLEGPVVWQFNNIFRADWYAETEEPLLELVENNDMPDVVGDSVMQVLPSGPTHDHANNLMVYTSLFHMAKKRISIVVPYFVPDESVLSAIISAVKRGVDVTIINSEIIDKVLVGHAQRSYYDELLEVGVKIYLYKSPIFLHNKQVLIDNSVAVTGSSNLDIRSFELDLELTLISYDPKIVAQLDKIEASYINKSTKISIKSWSKRPFRLKLLDRITRLTASLQ